MPNRPGEEEDDESLFGLDFEDEEKTPVPELFPNDEMSTGHTSSLIRRAQALVGSPDQPLATDPRMRAMTGAQLAHVPKTGSHPAFKPQTGTQPAFKPQTGAQPAYKPQTGAQPAFKPQTGAQPAYRPQPGSRAPVERPVEPEAPVFDERLQSQIRAMSLTDSALGRASTAAGRAPAKPARVPSSAVEDTFVKQKIKQAENNVPDFDLDEDL